MRAAVTTSQSAKGAKSTKKQAAQTNWILFNRPWHEIFIHVTVTFGVLFIFRSLVGDVSEIYQKNKAAYPVSDSIGKSYAATQCSDDYDEQISRYHAYLPPSCGIYITDRLGIADHVDGLLRMAQRVFDLGSTTMKEESSVFDLHTGILSRGQKFVNIFQYMKKKKQKHVLTSADIDHYNAVVAALLVRVSGEYQIPQHKLYLTQPSYFSKLSSSMPDARNEYWHPAATAAKGSENFVHYTAALYLSTYDKDFNGGRLIVMDGNNKSQLIEPKFGRLIFYNCGCEVTLQRVFSGYRYAFIVSFTLEESRAIGSPAVTGLQEETQFADKESETSSEIHGSRSQS